MQLQKTELNGVFLLEPRVFTDERGYFFESFQAKKLKELGIAAEFIQDNQSYSIKNTLRGLHYQAGAAAQAKLVRCLSGEIYDVVVDLRKESKTFGKWAGFVLNAQNKQQLFVPRGFAHGFSVLSATAEVAYKCDNYYSPKDERGIIWNDPDLKINWQVENPIVSGRDGKWPLLKNISGQDLF